MRNIPEKDSQVVIGLVAEDELIGVVDGPASGGDIIRWSTRPTVTV